MEELVECMESTDIEEMDCDTAFKMQRQIFTDKIEDEEFLEFATENFSEMFWYIVRGILNIRIQRNITGEMCFGVGMFQKRLFICA